LEYYFRLILFFLLDLNSLFKFYFINKINLDI